MPVTGKKSVEHRIAQKLGYTQDTFSDVLRCGHQHTPYRRLKKSNYLSDPLTSKITLTVHAFQNDGVTKVLAAG